MIKQLLLVLPLLLVTGCALPDFGFRVVGESEHTLKINWLGHEGFQIESPRTRLYINPYSAPIGSLKGSVILVSHSASDLCDLSNINLLSKEDSVIITPPECLARLGMSNVISMEVGKLYIVNEMSIETVDAYNLNGTISKGEGAGFIITVNNTRIYYAGVTDVIPEMKNIKDIDILLFPIAGGTLTMDMNDALVLISLINATHNVPMYYGGNTGTSLDIGRIMKSLAVPNGFNVTLLDNKDLLI